MTIEAHLQSIDASLKTIATALTALAEGAGAPVSKETDTKPEKPTRSRSSGSSKPANTKGSSAKPENKSPPPEKDGGSDDDGPDLADVRKALTALQKVTNAAAAKKVLKETGGATTLSKLDKGKYQDVIDEANQQKAAADDE